MGASPIDSFRGFGHRGEPRKARLIRPSFFEKKQHVFWLQPHEFSCILISQMSKSEKAIAKILSGQSDKNVSFDDAAYVLSISGFILDGGKGSYQVFRHPDKRRVVLPKHGKDLKPIYIRQIREILKTKK